MNVFPPGPFPPTGLLRGDGIDLGQCLLEDCYTGSHMEQEVRPRLLARLEGAVDEGDGPGADALLQAVVDTWPVSALVDAGVKLWTERVAAAALPVLGRAAELLRYAHGWSPLGSGPWPMPDQAWIQARLPEGATHICSRGQGDGAAAIAALTGLPQVDRSWALPQIAEVRGDELVSQRAALARQMVHAQIAAVAVSGPLPPGPEAALALGELRMEGFAQGAYEHFGTAGLLAPRAPSWQQLLRPAPPGSPGERLRQTCHTAILPSLTSGEPGPVAWLLWRGPHAPISVHPGAVALLGTLDGERDLRAVAAELGTSFEMISPMADELVRLGAASA